MRWLLAALPACSGGVDDKSSDTGTNSDADADSDADTDADTDADADSDADTDSDADSDADTDTGVPSDLDCDAELSSPDPGDAGLGACVTEEVFCGDTIFGTLAGGSTLYDYDYWESIGEVDSLFGEYDALDGAERVFVFRGLENGESAVITVSTCFDLWADWILYGDTSGDFCDQSEANTAGVFESGTGRTWWTTRLASGAGVYDYEFVIEGLYGAEGNFKLTVECN